MPFEILDKLVIKTVGEVEEEKEDKNKEGISNYHANIMKQVIFLLKLSNFILDCWIFNFERSNKSSGNCFIWPNMCG